MVGVLVAATSVGRDVAAARFPQLDNLNLAEEESNAFQQSLLLNNGAGSNFPLPEHGWIGVLGDFPSRVWINYRRDSAMAQAVEPEPEEKHCR